MERNVLLNVLEKNLNWFQKSSVMEPANGFWGVAERVYLCPDKDLRKKVFNSFNSFTDYGDWSVVESRRADCNFQAAYLFLLSADVRNDPADRAVAENLLGYLYHRSGLLNRDAGDESRKDMLGVWNWSHTQWAMVFWFDDNSWSLSIPLLIAERYPELAEQFEMTEWAEQLLPRLSEGFERTFHASLGKPDADFSDPEKVWRGRPLLPHWGSLCCFALATACRAKLGDVEKNLAIIRTYHEYLKNAPEEKLNVSELAYAVISSTAAYRATNDPFYLDLATGFADRILIKADPETGNIPAEHYEAPKGPHLVDTIYTANWILLGFQNLVRLLPGEAKYRTAYERLLALFAKIQDPSTERQFAGCWRGMYDTKTGTWGGGDCYEGGSGSIYSGWTNAPVSIVFANELLGTSLIG